MGKGYIDQKLKSANGWWNDRKCDESRYSICQKKKERMISPATTVAPPKGCPFVSQVHSCQLAASTCYICLQTPLTAVCKHLLQMSASTCYSCLQAPVTVVCKLLLLLSASYCSSYLKATGICVGVRTQKAKGDCGARCNL